MTRPSESELREKLAESYRYLDRHHLTDQSSGNNSGRLADGILISPTRATAETIGPDSFVKVGFEGNVVGSGKPSSELAMHLAIYRAVPDAGAIVHTHSDYCVGLASCRMPIPGFHYLVGTFGGTDIPCVPYSVFGSEALAAGAASALRDRHACLLANHGAIAYGETVETATMRAHRLEILARQYTLARTAGEPKLLTDEEFAEYREMSRRFAYR